jgi:23S rRNA (guanine2445-N2)-methyltransferase / 23S rRNA (guanine2069-N7)-methyltransferase
MQLVLIASRGAETVVAREAMAIVGGQPEIRAGSVHLEGTLRDAYRLRLGMRCASRLLMVLTRFEGTDGDAVYEGLASHPFEDLFSRRASFSIEAVGRGAEPLHFLTLRAKDAVVDRFRARTGDRPSVDKRDPDVRLHLHVHGRAGQLALDLGDGSLSRRGYRPGGASAPLRESLAATLLHLADYPAMAIEGKPMIDPMCGSGTLVIEAAMVAAGIAPGLARPSPRGVVSVHDLRVFDDVKRELEGARRPLAALPVLLGRDHDERALRLSRESARRAGVLEAVRFELGPMEAARPPAGAPPGLLLVNPPYGERLGDATDLLSLYERLGDLLRWHFPGYRAGVFTADETLSRRVGLKASRRYALHNGPLPSSLSIYEIHTETPRARPSWKEEPRAEAAMFRNRLEKNIRRLASYVRSRGLEAYRLYDRDIPEYAFAIDRYGDRLLVQEWAPPARIDPQLAASRARDVRLVLERTLEVEPEKIHFRRRRRRGRFDQVASAGAAADVFVVSEGEHRFEVELSDRLDTGLYLDHRELRRMAAKGVSGTRYLNLFAYTGSASVYAARAGARVVSVDLSRTYLDWAERNFRENGLDPRSYAFLRGDVFDFLERERGLFATIFCNPPSYSKSKSAGTELDVKRDHAHLIRLAMRRLEPEGRLFFSTHARGFELDAALARELRVEELSPKSVPPDFGRDAHRAYLIGHRGDSIR